MRVLVAPDKFKGTLTAGQAAEAIEMGWRRTRPADRVELVPMADGGEGTMDALVGALGGQIETATVTGPLGAPVVAGLGLAPGVGTGPATREGTTLGIVETARASGLELVPEARRDPTRATTRGTGELMARAIGLGATRLVVCLGGSATNDGGTGMAAALGCRFLDMEGRELREGGEPLLSLARIDTSEMRVTLSGVAIEGACDVDNPLVGPSGATAVYGPQKGASQDQVWVLDRALGHLAAVVHRDLGVDLKDEPGAGAAGGLGFGLLAFAGARLRRGVEVVIEASGLEERIVAAEVVITGEGSFDEQSLRGKVPAGVLDLARSHGVPAAVVCGRAGIRPAGVTVRSLVDAVGAEAAMGEARRSLETVAQELALHASDLAIGDLA
jgi:glycerate 2-kinase